MFQWVYPKFYLFSISLNFPFMKLVSFITSLAVSVLLQPLCFLLTGKLYTK